MKYIHIALIALIACISGSSFAGDEHRLQDMVEVPVADGVMHQTWNGVRSFSRAVHKSARFGANLFSSTMSGIERLMSYCENNPVSGAVCIIGGSCALYITYKKLQKFFRSLHAQGATIRSTTERTTEVN